MAIDAPGGLSPMQRLLWCWMVVESATWGMAAQFHADRGMALLRRATEEAKSTR